MRTKVLALFLLLTLAPALVARVSTNVPLNHWSYNTMDKLSEVGLTASDMPATKPFSRLEMARLIIESTEKAVQGPPPTEIVRDLLSRLQDEFSVEVDYLQGKEMSAGNFLKPIEDPYVRMVYSKNTPDLENESGDVFDTQDNWRAGFATRGVFWDRVSFYLHPEYKSPWEEGSRVRIIEGYGTLGLGPVDVQVGKDSLWWGPGNHGAMIMSRNAEGLPMLKVSNPSPVLLPWIFKYLGPFKFTYFVGELEEDRYQPNANLTGLRLDIKPLPNFEFGLSRTIMFGGDNYETNYWDYLQIFWPKNVQGNENQLAAIDASWRIPMPKKLPWRALKLYGEYAGEDSAGFSKYRPNIGMQVQDIGWHGSTDFRIEYAKTHLGESPGVFYNHHIFQSGYTHKGEVMGHHAGTDARDIFARLQHYLSADLIGGIYYDQEVLFPARQTRDQYGIDLTWFTRKQFIFHARYQYEDIKDDPTRPRWNHILDLGVSYNF